MSLLNAALEYAQAGYPVFPLKPKSKVPLTAHGVKDATTDEAIIRKWWEMEPNANIGVPMGKPSGVIAIDIDYKDGCRKNFMVGIPTTVVCNTPTGGNHAYFKYCNGEIKNGLKLEKGATIRSDGYYFVVPPSVHPETGTIYSWSGGHRGSLVDGEIAEIPEWVMEVAKKEEEKKEPLVLPSKILDGEGRERYLFDLASSLRGKGIEVEEILDALKIANKRCVPPKPLDDLVRISKSVGKYAKGNNKTQSTEVFDEKIPLPDKGAKGKPKGTIENVTALLNSLKIIVRYNVISKEEEILIPNETFTLDNRLNASLSFIVSWCNRVGIPTDNLSGFISSIADKNLYNPVATWVESKPWDGQSRLEDMYETVESHTPLKKVLMEKWFISCIAAIYEPNGISAQGVLVFRGNQYIGKTRWLKSLAPESLGVLKEGAILRPDDKDSVFQIISKWLVELGELDATFRKSDIAQLKAFITRDNDTIRRPYAKKESNFARRTVFFASVNEQCFLNDPTGNRRFWTLDCDAVNHEHCVDMQQFWAEIRMLYLSGKPWYLTTEENAALSDSNEAFQAMDPLEEKIRHVFDWEQKVVKEWLSASQVCERIGVLSPSPQQAKKVGASLRKLITQKTRLLDGVVRFPLPPEAIKPFNS